MELSPYPKVHVLNGQVIIEYSNGRRMLWSKEESEAEGKQVAAVLELELKVFEYIQGYVDELFSTLQDTLGSIAAEYLIDEYIHEVLTQKVRANYLRVI